MRVRRRAQREEGSEPSASVAFLETSTGVGGLWKTQDNYHLSRAWGFLGGSAVKEPACQRGRLKTRGFNPWVREIPWRRA